MNVAVVVAIVFTPLYVVELLSNMYVPPASFLDIETLYPVASVAVQDAVNPVVVIELNVIVGVPGVVAVVIESEKAVVKYCTSELVDATLTLA